MPCGQPILWCEKVRRCPEHMYLAATAVPTSLLRLTPLSESGEPAQLFYAEDGVVYGADGLTCGSYNAERKLLTLFEVEDEDEAAQN